MHWKFQSTEFVFEINHEKSAIRTRSEDTDPAFDKRTTRFLTLMQLISVQYMDQLRMVLNLLVAD